MDATRWAEMELTLLATKFYIPPLRPDLIPRSRLIDRLNEGLSVGHCLTLVSAPAGFGKTTLVSEWAAACDRKLAWLTLDQDHNAPFTFMGYFVAALQIVDRQIGQGLVDALQSSQPPSIDSMIIGLVNEIADHSRPFILVMDDYHLIENSEIHRVMAFLLDHMPESMHLVLVTRVEPPLPIAKLRGRGMLTELHREDLRFTEQEVADLFNQVIGLGLTEREIESLRYRTEGWIAGLQMAAFALQGMISARGGTSAGQFIESLAVSDRYVLDYLVEEVLQSQPEQVQRFLSATSILEQLCASLCDTILVEQSAAHRAGQDAEASTLEASTRSQQILEYLQRANLFVIPLDSDGIWFRYHRLFADLLRRRLYRENGVSIAALHKRASDWYEAHGYVPSAIDHALDAEDYDRAGRLIESTAENSLSRSEMSTLLDWLGALPDSAKRSRPALFLYHAWVKFLGGHSLDQVDALLKQAEMHDQNKALSGELSALRASLAIMEGEIDSSIQLANEALHSLPEERVYLRGLAIRNLGSAHELRGNLAPAISAFEQAVRLDQRAGNIVGAVVGLTKLAELSAIQGRLNEAYELYQQALDVGVDRSGNFLPITGRALIGMGSILREWNQLEAGEKVLRDGIELVRRWTHVWAIGGYIGLARVRQAQGDPSAANEAVRTASRLAIEFDASEVDDLVVSLVRIRLWLQQGRIELARTWYADRDRTGVAPVGGVGEVLVGVPTSYALNEMEIITRARLYLAQGQFLDAERLLVPLQKEEEELGRNGALIEILVLRALIAQRKEDREQAVSYLERAISLAEADGYVRIFLDEGPPMTRLLHLAASIGSATAYTGKILAQYKPDPMSIGAGLPDDAVPIVEPLSDREVEILQLISKGLSNQEVADRLYISLRTVKWHSSNIYQKLGVRNRTQAVNKARGLGLIG